MSLQVALKTEKIRNTFLFFWTITVLCTVLRPAAGPLALVNVSFLIADADLAVKDLLICLPVLQHLGVDSKTMP